MDDKLLEIFAEEAQEIIEALEEGLLALERGPDPEKVNTVFRAAHTMKGNAGIVGFEEVVELTHLMEGVLDQMRQGSREPGGPVMGQLLKATDQLKGMIQARMEGQGPRPADELLSELAPLLDQGSPPPPRPARPAPAPAALPAQSGGRQRLHLSIKLPRHVFTMGTDPMQLFLELEELGQVERVVCHSEQLPPFAGLDPFQLYLWWELWLLTGHPISTVENVFIFVRDEGEITVRPSGEAPANQAPERPSRAQAPAARQAPAEPAAPKASPPSPAPRSVPMAAPTIRVDTGKLDKLINLVGEMVIGLGRVSEGVGPYAAPELQSALESMGRISREMQQQVMRVRMVPVEGTFNRFRRMVRDLAAELGKDIRLELSGLDTELDKNVAEQMADPLGHLVRNAAVHGLEAPEERRAAGKPAEGTIWLRAYQQGGRIFIEVADDGRGVDAEQVRQRAEALGLIPPDARPGPEEIHELLFHPGFSTASQVTELSGRGVGLDVVRENIESLRGSVEVDSSPGLGATFRIKLPLTLAIIDGMNVKVAGETFVLPMLSIVESMKPRPDQLRTVRGKGELIRHREGYLPLVRLARLFCLEGGVEDPCEGLVMIIGSLGKRFGLLVDDILGERQAVIKSIEQNYQKVPGIGGATILADGRVGLVLDVPSLEKMSLETGEAH
ncbi:MAG: chemotaxis protein CheA [Desulfarculaceae bacterium]|nr:chemotaxis protein CheA [Desulfarculaceae bacterium]